MNEEMPNQEQITRLANEMGIKNLRFTNDGLFGWIMHGEGCSKKEPYWDLISIMARTTNMAHGGGSKNWIQIRPDRFELPKNND